MVHCLMAMLVMLGPLVILGCDSGDEDDEDQFADVEPADLDNLTFVFPDGRAFGPTLVGDQVTLVVGDFGGDNTAPIAIRSGGNVAFGIITIASCAVRIDESDFGIGAGPQDDDLIPWDPCEVNVDTGEICVTNEVTEEESCSNVPSINTGTGGGGGT
jgi:hypothetical protein